MFSILARDLVAPNSARRYSIRRSRQQKVRVIHIQGRGAIADVARTRLAPHAPLGILGRVRLCQDSIEVREPYRRLNANEQLGIERNEIL